MRLFLSSSGISTVELHWQRLHELVGDSKRVLFINNAKDYYTSAARRADVNEKIAGFKRAGFNASELDLRKYFESPEKLKDIVTSASFIWASGGNEFLLRKAYAYTGFDKLLVDALKNNMLAYGGSSAGMMILTKTLHGCEEWDDASVIPEGYKQEILWDGLGLVDVQLVPRYKSGWADEQANNLIRYYEHKDMEYMALRDGEAYLIDGDQEELLK